MIDEYKQEIVSGVQLGPTAGKRNINLAYSLPWLKTTFKGRGREYRADTTPSLPSCAPEEYHLLFISESMKESN